MVVVFQTPIRPVDLFPGMLLRGASGCFVGGEDPDAVVAAFVVGVVDEVAAGDDVDVGLLLLWRHGWRSLFFWLDCDCSKEIDGGNVKWKTRSHA